MKTVKMTIKRATDYLCVYAIADFGYASSPRQIGNEQHLNQWLSQNCVSFQKMSDTEFLLKINSATEKKMVARKSKVARDNSRIVADQQSRMRIMGNKI